MPRVEDLESCTRMAEVIRLAGYSAVGLTIPTGLLRGRVHDIKQIFYRAGIETALRIDLSPSSRLELLRLLRRFRNSYDVVGVRCTNHNVAISAFRDRRVDIVFRGLLDNRISLTRPLANLLRGAFEFNLVSVFQEGYGSQALFRITKEAEVARRTNVRVVLSSGAINPYMMRTPMQIAALGSATGLSTEQCTSGVSQTPLDIITHNMRKRSPSYIEEGVRVLSAKAGYTR